MEKEDDDSENITALPIHIFLLLFLNIRQVLMDRCVSNLPGMEVERKRRKREVKEA